MPSAQEAPAQVPDGSVVVTHLSFLVFGEDMVFKYKRPVQLPFVDFRSADARKRACEAEVEGNRRLSPDVYLGVAEVRLGDEVVDHAVVMRRLPAERSLSAMVTDGKRPELRQVAGLARQLADFHARCDRSSEIDNAARPLELAVTWQSVVAALKPYADDIGGEQMLRRVDGLGKRFLSGRKTLFEARIAAGHVCDGHGDLLADDVYLLDDGPRILDCIDFDLRLRHVDVAADVAFLVMDLESKGAPDVARSFLHSYEAASRHPIPRPLLGYYCAERALVRALVACLRSSGGGSDHGERRDLDEAAHLVSLASGYLRRWRPVLMVMSGLPGSGKSTVATVVAERLGCQVLSSDDIRREIVDPSARGPLLEATHPSAYSSDTTRTTYRTMVDRARLALSQGESVVLDATFADPVWREEVAGLARDRSSDMYVFECRAPLDVMARRVRLRLAAGTDISGADAEVLNAMASVAAPWPRAIVLDTNSYPASKLADEVATAAFGASYPEMGSFGPATDGGARLTVAT